MDDADQLRELLTLANHILANEGVVDAFGHVSARHPHRPDRYLLSRSCSPALVEPDDIMEFDLAGNPVGADERAPYLERFIHGAIYEARPDVHSVVHNHAHELIPYGVTNTPMRPLIHMAGAMGCQSPVWDIRDRFGDTSLLVTNMDQARDLAATLADNASALMRGHGVVVAGSCVREAVLVSIYLKVNAAVDLQARQLGDVKYLSPGEIAQSEYALLSENPAARAWAYFASRARA